MSTPAQAAIWGFLAGLPLLIGAAIALWKRPSDRVVGLVAASHSRSTAWSSLAGFEPGRELVALRTL